MLEHKCEVCGRLYRKKLKANGMIVCGKHYNQFKKYGKFTDLTPRIDSDKNEITIDGVLNEDLISMDVYSDDSFIGKVTDILNNGVYDILVIENDNNKSLVPNIGEFIKNIDLDNMKIQINMIEGLINEN